MAEEVWWVLEEKELFDMLNRVKSGEDVDSVYLEHYANSEHEYHDGSEEDETIPLEWEYYHGFVMGESFFGSLDPINASQASSLLESGQRVSRRGVGPFEEVLEVPTLEED